MHLTLEKNTQSLQTTMREGFNQLEDKLALADQGQDEKAAELKTYADKISSELEMAEANSKQENNDLHDRLDKEIKMLTVKFTEQLNQALEKLTQVSNQLNSSKTNRKTLAKLLSTVASNLETDEGEQPEKWHSQTNRNPATLIPNRCAKSANWCWVKMVNKLNKP